MSSGSDQVISVRAGLLQTQLSSALLFKCGSGENVSSGSGLSWVGLFQKLLVLSNFITTTFIFNFVDS